MYHPVEKPVFDAAGDTVLDLTHDVHEFIELWNAGSSPVNLAGWRLMGGIRVVFPVGTVLPAGGFLVVAKDPDRLEAVPAYALSSHRVFGPWQGGLSNSGDTIRLESLTGTPTDSVSYSSAAPWPIGAHAFGAESHWTGIDEFAHQYRGRSLERVAVAWASNDPANRLASLIGICFWEPALGRGARVM
ncbi:MAG: lamin tail domain-containing protein [Verrucomicrobiales bacterium]